jgi:hypothetical protein
MVASRSSVPFVSNPNCQFGSSASLSSEATHLIARIDTVCDQRNDNLLPATSAAFLAARPELGFGLGDVANLKRDRRAVSARPLWKIREKPRVAHHRMKRSRLIEDY